MKKKKIQGFSLIELMIALGVTAIILVLVSGMIAQFTQKSKDMGTKVSKDVETKSFGQNFINIVEASAVAIQFEHLPIKLGGNCVTPTFPTVCELNPKQEWQAGPSIPNNPPSIEFFRDHSGTLTPIKAYEGTDSLQVKSTQPLSLPSDTFKKKYYTAWPLVDDKSPHFILLKRPNVDDYFLFNSKCSDSSPTPNTAVLYYGSHTYYDSKTQLNWLSLKGSLVVVYNPSNPEQYFFQQINDISDCKNGSCMNLCSVTDQNALNNQFKITLGSIPLSIASIAKIPDSNGLQITPDSWNTPSSFYLFPTTQTSFVPPPPQQQNSDYEGLYPPLDIRKVGYYFQQHPKRKGKLVVIPVQMVSYYLQPPKSPSPNHWDLYLGTVNWNATASQFKLNEIKIVENVIKVVIGRRLGTSEISVFLYQ